MADAPKTFRERLAPRVRTGSDYLASSVFVRGVNEISSAVLISAYAISRVSTHRLSPATTAAILIATATTTATVTSIISFFAALGDAAGGMVTKDATHKPLPDGPDPLAARSVWGRALASGLGGALWGTGLAFLALAAINRRETHFLGMFIGVLISAGVAGLASGLANTAIGVRVGLSLPKSAAVRPARHRAWRELALPFAIVFGLFSSAFSLLLFHDYHVGSQFTKHVLTEKEILNDLLIQIVIGTWLANFVLGRAGRAEATLGLVRFEDPDAQVPKGKTIYGIQALIGVAIVMLFLGGSIIRFVLPAYPNLVETVIARGAFAFVTAFLAAGIAYMRGAANATVAARR